MIQYLCPAAFQSQFCCRPRGSAGRTAQFQLKFEKYTRYKPQKNGMVYTWYIPSKWQVYEKCHIPGIYRGLSYDLRSYHRYIPVIYHWQVYTVRRRHWHMSGIYQVYTIIINFLVRGFPDGHGHIWNPDNLTYTVIYPHILGI
jgi:hypothetical protein